MSEAIRTAFALRRGIQLLARLGMGRDGDVYLTDRWNDVDLVLAELTRRTGLVMLDVNPGNIRFADQSTP